MIHSGTIRTSLFALFGAFWLLAPLTAAEVTPPAAPPPAAAPAPATPAQGRALLKIVIGDSVEVVEKTMPAESGAFVTVAPTLPQQNLAELSSRLAAGEGKIIEERILAAIAQVIENFFRQLDYPGASAIVPSQNIKPGVLRVIVLLGKKSEPITAASSWKIRNIKMDGARWFSESLLREKLRIEQGGVVRFGDLDRAISWTNNNPFRRVKVKLDPVPNTGEADLTIAVQEVLPLRLSAAYDNTGNSILGRSRYTAAVSYANLWGLDHQVSYQYMTGDVARYFTGHGMDYRVPLPWRHYVQLSASYIRAKPEFYDGLFVQDGKTVTSDLRYTVPVLAGDNSLDVFAALSFKQSNNNLAFGGTEVLDTTTDVFQFSTGASMVRRDRRGAWAFAASLTASPGGVNSRNSDAAFDATRFGARSSYLYASLTVQRLVNLGQGWDYLGRGVFQAAQRNLLASEQLSVGGSSSVRGFAENVYSGDNGYVFVNELLSPFWKLNLPKISKTRGPLETRFVAFFDAGDTSLHAKTGTDPKHVALTSAGVGVRSSLGQNFSLTADYGWQISTLPYTNPDHTRGHVKVSLAY